MSIITDWLNKLFQRPQSEKTYNRIDQLGFWGAPSDIYASDYVNNAIDRVASEISKIDVKSVVVKDDMITVQNDDITRLFRYGPNPLQTTKDFLSSIEWIRRKFYNVFVYPVFEMIQQPNGNQTKRFLEFYVLKPLDFEVGVDKSGFVWEIKFLLEDGKSYILPYSDLIHMKWRRGTNLYKGGGDDWGNVQTADLTKSVTALNATIEGLPKAIANSMQVKGVYNATTLLDSAQQAEQRKKFEDHIIDSKLGMVVTDLAGQFTPVNSQVPVISAANMKFMKSGIVQRYGVNEAVLDGDYTGSQHSSFYQTAIEDFIVDAEQEFTRKCFSDREQNIGHQLKFYYSRIKYLNTSDQLEVMRISKDEGLLTLNQQLEMIGLPPFDGGNIRLRSLNYVDASIANQYQLSTAGSVQKAGTESGQEGQIKEEEDDSQNQ